MDAVETAMKVPEDNPLFNAGTGPVLTFDGEVEMDAAVAHGPALGFGAIAGIKNIEHPSHWHAWSWRRGTAFSFRAVALRSSLA
jgi:isoaspartyl peptidase/L-asparaginase-like protein (Ntn-hydrolase superfamily)